jgi:hypothetical protein
MDRETVQQGAGIKKTQPRAVCHVIANPITVCGEQRPWPTQTPIVDSRAHRSCLNASRAVHLGTVKFVDFLRGCIVSLTLFWHGFKIPTLGVVIGRGLLCKKHFLSAKGKKEEKKKKGEKGKRKNGREGFIWRRV